MPDKITTLKLVDNTDVFPNIKDENIPDTIMRIADLSKYLNQLKSINIPGDIVSTTITSDIATFTTADISTLNVSGISRFEGEATFGHNVHVDGNLVVNGIDNIIDKDGNKIVKNETLDEFATRFYGNCDVAYYMSKEIRSDSYVLGSEKIFVPYADKVTNLSSFCQNVTAKNMFSEAFVSINVPDIENIVEAITMFAYASCASIIFNNITINEGEYAFAFMRNVETIGVADGKTAKLEGNLWGLFYKSGSVVEIGAFDISGATYYGPIMFSGCYSLKKLHLKHFRLSFDISGSTAFEQSDLVEIISNLDLISTPQTMTIGATNLAKLTQDQILVATGKGWTLA